MIDKNEFLKIMKYLEEQHTRDVALEKAISARCDGIVSLNENLNLEAFLMLAKETIDPDEFINWFVLDHASFEIGQGDKTITIDTHEKLYDFLAKEYPHAPKMIPKPMFLKIINMMAEQEKVNRKFAWDLEHYIECQFAIHHDSYVSALMILIQQTFDFGDSYSYWLYEDCKSYEVDGVTVDISTPSKLYDEIAKEFKACDGKLPAPKPIDPKAKVLTEQELFEMMKKTVMNNPKLLR